jgi:hypothetical protein
MPCNTAATSLEGTTVSEVAAIVNSPARDELVEAMAIAVVIACCLSGAAALRVAPSALRPFSALTRGGAPVAFYGAEAAGSTAAASVAQRASLLVADVMTDTVMDIAVYTLLAGVLGLTVYSVSRLANEASHGRRPRSLPL